MFAKCFAIAAKKRVLCLKIKHWNGNDFSFQTIFRSNDEFLQVTRYKKIERLKKQIENKVLVFERYTACL